ncbi:MAG TPA: LuxR C-terminal-related transcriptional regulator [Conexibacter sp.]
MDPHEFLYEVAERLARIVPHDASGWMTLDPDTLLPTGGFETGVARFMVRELWRNERQDGDVNNLVDVVRRKSPVAVFDDLDPSIRAQSARVQKILGPAGVRHEMRTLLRSAGSAWGASVLFRETASPRFGLRERAFMEAVASEIGDGLRRSLARRPARDLDPFVPGVVALHPDAQISAATDDAIKLMRLMRGDATNTLHTLAVDANAGRAAHARVRLTDGRWLILHGARLIGAPPGSAQTSVTFMPPPAAELMSVLVRLHGLTFREREVAAQLAVGTEPEEISRLLKISRFTLRNHVRSVFAKLHVTSAAQLTALLSSGVPASE